MGSPFGGPWGWHFGGSFWFGGTLHWVLLFEIRLRGVPPGRVKKRLKHEFLLRFTNRGSRATARLTVRRWVLFVRVGQGALVPFWGVLGALGLVLQWPIYFSSCSVVWVLSPSISVCSFAASTPRVYTILSVALWVHCLVAQFATCVPQHSMVFSDLVLVLCALLGACCCACIPFGVVLNIQLFLDVASWGIFWVGLWGPTSKDD